MEKVKALKAKNRLIIVGVLSGDALLFALVSAWPSLDLDTAWESGAVARAIFAALVPVIVLLLGSLIPSSAKAVMVFWRLKHALPGHRAFEEQGLSDPRIDRDQLRKNIGAFPSDPSEQNATWYRLFKKVETDPSIEHAHGQFLLLRDLASITVLLLPGCLFAWLAKVLSNQDAIALAAILTAQFILSMLSARSQGEGLVRTVLALHGAKRRV